MRVLDFPSMCVTSFIMSTSGGSVMSKADYIMQWEVALYFYFLVQNGVID